MTPVFNLFSWRSTQCNVDSSYRVIMMLFSFLGKKKEKSDLKTTKPSLHSPEFYFQGIQRFETQLFLQRDYAVNVRTTKLVLFFFFLNQVIGSSSNLFTEIYYRGTKFWVLCHTWEAVWSSCRQVCNLQGKSSVGRYFSVPQSL